MLRSCDAKAAARWLAIRIAALPLIFIAVSFVSYFLIYGPSTTDPLCCSIDLTAEERERLRHELGLNDPWIQRYGEWLADAVQGDFGTYKFTGESVAGTAAERAWPTLELVALSLFLIALALTALTVSITKLRDGAGRTIAQTCVLLVSSLPIFLVGTLTFIVPSDQWGYKPPGLQATAHLLNEPWDNLRQFGPPALLVALATFGLPARYLWSRRDGSRLAFSEWPNAFLIFLPILLTSVIVVENVFYIRGVGLSFFRALVTLDQALAQLLLTAILMLSVVVWLCAPNRLRRESPMTQEPPKVGVLARSPAALLAFTFVALFIIVGAIGPSITPRDPNELRPDTRNLSGEIVSVRLQNPSREHPFGTNNRGQDIFSRVIAGARPSARFGLSVLLVGFMPAVVVGIGLGRLGDPWTHASVDLVSSVVLSIPAFPMVLAGMALRSSSLNWTIGLTALFAAALGLRAAAPVSHLRAVPFKEVLVRLRVPLAATAVEVLALAVLLHATIAWLGLEPFFRGTDSWGAEVGYAHRFRSTNYPQFVFPGATLVLVLFACAVLADSLRKTVNQVTDSSDSAGTPSS